MSYLLPHNPRSLGDLVGLAFRLLRAHWRLVIQRFLTPSIFMSVSIAGLEWCFVHWVQAQSMDVGWFAIHIVFAFALVIILIASQWEIALRSAALIRFVLIEDYNFDEGYEYARKKQWSILSVYAVSFLVPMAVCFFWFFLFGLTAFFGQSGFVGKLMCIPLGFLEGVFFVATFSFSMLYTALCFIVVSVKDPSIGGALLEGYRLSAAKLSRGLSFVCLLAVAIFLMMMVFYIPVAILGIWDAYVQGIMNETEFPIWLRVLDATVGCVTNIISVGAALFGISAYYRDLKMRSYGEDILEAIELKSK